MRVNEYTDFLASKAWPKGRKTLVKGAPGVGKTYGARTAAKRLGMDFIGLCCPLLSPVKVGGYPRPPAEPDGEATHCLFDGISKAFKATKPTVLFWDDLGMANGETLKAIVELVQFGQIDGRKLPDCVVQAGATNDIGHGADVQGLIEPLKTRWHSIFSVETHVDDVVQYGLAEGWPSDLCAFLRNAPDSLHSWKPSKDISINGATPRGWEYAAQWINDGVEDPEVIAGCVGKGEAMKYLSFRKLINELPDIDGVLMDPMGAIVPENPGARFLVACALSSRMSSGNFSACVKYLHRLPAVIRAFSIRDALMVETKKRQDHKLPKGYSPITSSRDFTAWAMTQDGKDIVAAAS